LFSWKTKEERGRELSSSALLFGLWRKKALFLWHGSDMAEERSIFFSQKITKIKIFK